MSDMQDAPSFHRNKQPMLSVLTPLLDGDEKHVLEIASGSGQHGPFFTDTLANLRWWPSDISTQALNSINAWRTHLNANAVNAPQIVDVTGADWRDDNQLDQGPEKFDCILSMNMIHIAPFAATTGLIEGASKRLNSSGFLVFYGPFKRHGEHTAPSNQAFDESLQSRNADWGIRDLEEIIDLADKNHLAHSNTIEMPANNLVVIFKR